VTLAALPHNDAAGTAGPPSAALGERSDEDLLGAVGRGDPDALGLLYDRYGRLALAVAYRVLGDYHAAEDTAQDAFLAVWRRVDSFDPRRGTVHGWVLTIVRNAAVDRRRGRHAHTLRDAPLDEVAFRLATEGEETFAVVAASVEARRVREALATLPAEQREAIELAYFGGLTHREIAERTGATLGTVKGRMRLGLHKLRATLADLIPPDAAGSVPGHLPPVTNEPPKPEHGSAFAVAGRWLAPRTAVRGGPHLLAPAG
jgi:RNA polymerase sigma-70 factor, ECF subfamily